MADQTKYARRLQNKRGLFIGGTSGLGFSAAEAAVESGVSVVVSSSNPERVENAVLRLKKAYPSHASDITGHVCDLDNDETLEANIVDLLKKATEDGAKKLDHIVFTATRKLKIKTLKESTLEDMHRVGRIRFFGPLLVGKHAPSYMTNSHESSITVTTGVVSEHPMPNWTVIGSFSSGIHGMVRAMGLDLAPIRVNAVSPGAVDTELWADIPEPTRKQMYAGMEKGMTTGRMAQPEDIAESYLYLMKDYNITGAIISTNGGQLLK